MSRGETLQEIVKKLCNSEDFLEDIAKQNGLDPAETSVPIQPSDRTLEIECSSLPMFPDYNALWISDDTEIYIVRFKNSTKLWWVVNGNNEEIGVFRLRQYEGDKMRRVVIESTLGLYNLTIEDTELAYVPGKLEDPDVEREFTSGSWFTPPVFPNSK